MNEHACKIVVGAGANDAFVRLGFAPDFVRVTEFGTGLGFVWSRAMGNDSSITRVAAGDRTVQSDKGIKLVYMTDESLNLSADPTEVADGEWYKANGIQLTSDCGVLTDGKVVIVEAWRADVQFVRAVHDGGDNCNTYFQDASIDFKDAGISGGQQFVIININNDNYAYIKSVTKPAGQTKYCRLNVSDSGGTDLAAADFDDNDVCIILPKNELQYPMSDIGAMS